MQQVYKVGYSTSSGEITFAKFFDLDRAISFVLIPDSELPWHRSWKSFKEVSPNKSKLIQWESGNSSVWIAADYA